jgi:hypothetical protein
LTLIPIFGVGIVGHVGHFERRSAAVEPQRCVDIAESRHSAVAPDISAWAALVRAVS